MPDNRLGKMPTMWTGDKRRMSIRIRMCTCGHGKDAHRDGRGYCVGEKQLADGAYADCPCHFFSERVDPERFTRRDRPAPDETFWTD